RMVGLGLAAVQRVDMKWGKIWLFSTALLGLVFLGGQVIEFTEFVHKGLTMSTNLFVCTFFVLTGTHGAHVAVGVLWLLTLWVRALQGKLGPGNAMTVEITGLYWHFDGHGVPRTELPLRSEEHTSELQSPDHIVCRLLLKKKKQLNNYHIHTNRR